MKRGLLIFLILVGVVVLAGVFSSLGVTGEATITGYTINGCGKHMGGGHWTYSCGHCSQSACIGAGCGEVYDLDGHYESCQSPGQLTSGISDSAMGCQFGETSCPPGYQCINNECVVPQQDTEITVIKQNLGEITTIGGLSIKTEYIGRTGAKINMGGEIVNDVRVNDIIRGGGQYFFVESVNLRTGVQLVQLNKGEAYCTTTSGKMTVPKYI